MGSAPFGTPGAAVRRGTYHPFLGKDVTLHIYSSEGEICAAAFGSPGERKTTFAPVTICSELVTHDAR